MTPRRPVAHPQRPKHDDRHRHRDLDIDIEIDADDPLTTSPDGDDGFDASPGDDETVYVRQFLGDHGLDDDDPSDQKPPGEWQ